MARYERIGKRVIHYHKGEEDITVRIVWYDREHDRYFVDLCGTCETVFCEDGEWRTEGFWCI